MSASPATNLLDHIVHLTPGQSLQVPSSNFKDIGFNVVYGGSHADGISSNMLIVLQDGIYLELLIFNHPTPPSEHWWADRQPGWIDMASAGTDENINSLVNDRLGSPLFKPSTTGGRFTKSPEGEERELRWRITQPDQSLRKGEVPFFTEDITPRAWRVPAIPADNTIHPNGALGVATITYIAPADNLQAFANQITAFYGSEPTTKAVDGKQVRAWSLIVPSAIEVDTKDGKQKLVTEFHLREADNEVEEERKRGTGLYEVALWTSKGLGTENVLADNKYGRVRFRSINTL